MYCSKCGIQNSDGSTHCVNCGSVLMDVSPEQQMGAHAVPVMDIEPKTSRLAITSFVMGLLCMTCVLWPILVFPAIICGIIALVKISNNKLCLKGTGYAVTGIAIPAVMIILIPIFAMLLAILMPALAKARVTSEAVVCRMNLKSLATGMMVYANDYDDMLPTGNWSDLLIVEADNSPKSFVCPDSETIEGESSYAMNIHIAGMKLSDIPPDIVLFFETGMGLESGPRNAPITIRRHYEYYGYYDERNLVYEGRFNQLGGPEDLLLRHGSSSMFGCNIAFADGRTEFVIQDRIADLQWTVEE